MRIANYIAFIAVGMAFVVTGTSETSITHIHQKFIARTLGPDHPLPPLTVAVMDLTDSHAFIYLNLLLSIAFPSLLFYLERGPENRKTWMPLCLTLALIICLLQLATVSTAVTMPYVFYSYSTH